MDRLNFALRRPPNSLSPISSATGARTRTARGERLAHAAHAALHAVARRKDPLYDGLRTARTGMHAPFDGIASVWFDSREDLVAATTSPEGRKAGALLLEDERRFIDLSRSPLWVSQEVVQINPMPENSIVAWPKSSWIKFCYLLQPKEGMSQAACHKTWNMETGT